MYGIASIKQTNDSVMRKRIKKRHTPVQRRVRGGNREGEKEIEI